MVAAERREFAGLLRRVERPVRLQWPLEWCCGAGLGDRRLLLVANGAGERLAEEALAVARDRASFDAVISTGFCGALDPNLRPGELFVASRVESLEREGSIAALRPQTGRAHASGVLLTANRVIQTVAEKHRLRERGAEAVDMEAAAVGARSAEWGLPYYAVRSVTDTADEDIKCDLNRVRGADGRIRNERVLADALRRPVSRLPELWRLLGRSRLAAETLGDFLVNSDY